MRWTFAPALALALAAPTAMAQAPAADAAQPPAVSTPPPAETPTPPPAPAPAAASAPAASGRTLTGRVVDELTGDGIPLVRVVIEGTHIGVEADVEGRFVFDNVPL